MAKAGVMSGAAEESAWDDEIFVGGGAWTGSLGPQRPADRQVRDAVAAALDAIGGRGVLGLDVQVCHGVVMVWGQVARYYDKQRLQERIRRVSGVREIVNNLEVAGSGLGQPAFAREAS